jgi:nucleoside-diphosphate-sugar epimerase
MARTVLVTGGLGFIGSHVVQALLRAGSDVVVIDRETDGNAADEILEAPERAAVPVIARAIPARRSLAKLLRVHRVDTIVHLASPMQTVTESDPRLTVDGMIGPQIAILDAARIAGARKVVWASSVGVFGRNEDYPRLPIANDAPHRPLTLYGAAKSFMEQLADRYTACHGLDTLGLRFPLVYGPGRRRGGGQFTTQLIERAALGRPCEVGGGDARYDWMYVTDAARSVELAIDADQTPSRALTVTGEVGSVGDVADFLRGWFPDAAIDVRAGSSPLVADFDPNPARSEIGYEPQVGLRAGVLATANAARRRHGLAEVR